MSALSHDYIAITRSYVLDAFKRRYRETDGTQAQFNGVSVCKVFLSAILSTIFWERTCGGFCASSICLFTINNILRADLWRFLCIFNMPSLFCLAFVCWQHNNIYTDIMCRNLNFFQTLDAMKNAVEKQDARIMLMSRHVDMTEPGDSFVRGKTEYIEW